MFRKSIEELKFSLKSEKNNRYFAWRLLYIFVIFPSFLPRMGNVSDKPCLENINAHFNCSNFFPENNVIHENTCKNILGSDGPQMRVWRIAHFVLQSSRHTLKLRIPVAFPRQKWWRQRSSIWRSTHIACLVTFTLCHNAVIAGFEFLTAKEMKFQIFWDVTGDMSSSKWLLTFRRILLLLS